MPTQSDEARLRAVVDTAVDGVILIDARGSILMFNPACEKLFGYARADVIGQNVKMLMPPPYHEEHDGYLANYRTTRRAKIIGIGREVTGRRKDGTTFPMELSVGEARQDKGSIFVGIIRDLTERKQALDALRESAARLEAVVATAVDGVILIDARGSVLMFNPACEKLFGYRRDEVIGRNVKMLMPSPYHEEHDGYLANYHATRRAKIIGIGREVTGRRKDGTTFPMDLSVGEAKDEHGSVFVGVIHSLSERKRIEAQLAQAQKMEAVGQLSGGIAHDFNNLLTVIIGNADTLSERLKSRPDLARLADQIVSAGQRGADLTQRLLAYGRRQMLQPAEVDCNALIETLREMLRRTMREDIEIRTELDPALYAAYADPAQLEAAILNLSLNAQDAMPLGGCLTIATMNMPLDERYRDMHPEVPPGHYVMIAVTDDGMGMPKDVRERAFEPFFTTKEVGKGSGLGLSMVYGFAKQSNGHVSLYSEPGLGTTIRIYLPASTSVPVTEEAKSDAELPRGHGVVLVAEDDPVVRSYAVSCLESLGYRAIATKDGNEALEKLRNDPEIAILFSDVVMPGGMTGWDLAERARVLRPDLKILLTSGYAIESLASRGRINPEFAVLNKPYRKIELARRLRDVLERT